MELPENLFYTETHEWVRVEGDRVTVGITDYAQDQLKDVVYVELPEIGLEIKKGDSLGTVESVKTLADLYSPVTGRVVEINLALKDHPQFVNEDPFGKGWMVKLAILDREDLKGLLSAKDYKGTIPEEG
jgi:glycine cleavage system H protein